MENNNQNTELELMRSQMEDFKAQLDKQKIVNEKMIIGSMKKSMSWIKRYVYFECSLVPIIAVSWLAIKEFAHLSWLNYAFLMTMVIVSVIADYRINVSAISDAQKALSLFYPQYLFTIDFSTHINYICMKEYI